MGFHNAVFKIVMERLQCAWILMRWCIMLTLIKTGDFCEIHGSLLIEETMKAHIQMTWVGLQLIHNESVYSKTVYN